MLVVMSREFNGCSECLCPCDRKRCKRFGYDGFPACFVYDVNGVLRFVGRRFVAPKGFSVPKQLSPKDIKGKNG
jgi:hypothetical protein